MRKNGITLLIPIGFVLLMILVILSLPLGQASEAQIQFLDPDRNISLSLYYDETDDRQYLFLPSFLPVEDLVLSCPWYMHAELTDGSQTPIHISAAPLDTDLFLTVKALGQQEQRHSLRILQGSARKTISIQAQGNVMEHITDDKSHKGTVAVTILDETGHSEFEGSSTISGRGNGSWFSEKKPYNLDFPQKVSFGPFQNIQKLCLLAEYTDESKMRNAIALQAGALQNIPFTSPYCYADVYVNGQYYGLYGLTTKDTYQHDSNVRAVFEVPSWDNTIHFRTGMGINIKVHSGSQSEIEQQLQKMEAAISARDWTALSQIADTESFCKKYILDDFLCNLDTSYGSQYFYLDTDGVVHSMLPWDYDWSLFSRVVHFDWLSERQIAANFYSSVWWSDFLAFPEFREGLCTQLSQNYTDAFFDALDQYTANCITEMSASRLCDSLRWPEYFTGYDIRSGFTDLAQFRTLFREYYPRRVSFLQTYWAAPESHVTVTLRRSSLDTPGILPFQYHYIFPSGTDLSQYEDLILRSTPKHTAWEFLGWYSDTGVPLKEIGAVTQDLTLIGECRLPLPEGFVEETVPIPENSPSSDLPAQDAPVPEAADNAPDTLAPETAGNVSDTPTPETADNVPEIPFSTISAAFSVLFLAFLFFLMIFECRRIHRQKEVHPSESKDKAIP